MERDNTAVLGGAVSLGVAIMLLVLLMVLAGSFATLFMNAQTDSIQFDPEPGQTEVLDDGAESVPDSVAVSPTSGGALGFSGDGDASTATWTSSGTPERGPWTVCSWVELSDGANLGATYDVAAVGNGSIQLEYDAGSWMAYYDNGTHSAVVRAEAPSPRDPVTICGRSDGESVDLIHDGSTVGSEPMTSDVEPRNVSVTLNGVVDEVRVSNSTVSDSRLQTYANKPTTPFDGTDRAARAMFDEREGTTSVVYFASSDAELTNPTWVNGVPTRELVEGTDYTWTEDPWGIQALAGGELEDAPVGYVYWRNGEALGGPVVQVVDIAGTAFGLMAVSLLAIPAIVLLVYLRSSGLLSLGNNARKR